MQINIIACLDQNGAIGYKNRLLFHIRKDMERFKQLTLNHTIVMGRKTYESLPHGALPLRRNIVITQQEIQLENCEVYHSLTDALEKCTDDIIFIIGGESIYKQCMHLADNLYLTIVDKKMPKADTYFPSINSENWEIIDKEQHKEIDDAKKEIYSFSFITFRKIGNKETTSPPKPSKYAFFLETTKKIERNLQVINKLPQKSINY